MNIVSLPVNIFACFGPRYQIIVFANFWEVLSLHNIVPGHDEINHNVDNKHRSHI
jgi:hypothetical protein